MAKRARPVLFELVRRQPGRDAPVRIRGREGDSPPATPAAQPRPTPAAPNSAPGTTRPAPAIKPDRPEREAVVGKSAPAVYGVREGPTLVSRLREALLHWRRRIESAPPWATALALIVLILFFLWLSFQVYRAFAPADPTRSPPANNTADAPVTDSTRPPAPGPVVPRREAPQPTIGSGLPPAAPIRPEGPLPDPGPGTGADRKPPEADRRSPDSASPPAREPAVDGSIIPASEAKLEKGRHYLHVQYFRRTRRQDALDARAFLATKGIQTMLIEATGEYRLLAADSFLIDQKDKTAAAAERKRCDDLKRRIRDAGREYAKKAGYAFDQCFDRKN
ncbi:MAG: hypothetical protein IPM64_01115 [Phycisphaerales bacterium]|nr:hypothetical protein [Phycisphaerales bacterium]